MTLSHSTFPRAVSFDVSVIICAYTDDRWEHLVAAVQSIQQQSIVPREIILIVDHNPHLLERALKNLPNLIIRENQEPPGLSGSRNSGVAIAKSSFVAFLDDDAVATPFWLERLQSDCENSQVLGVGSAVEPKWEGAKPAWLPEEFYWVIGCTYRGLPETRDQIRNPIGAAMCLRKEIFDQVGGFRNGIGRVGKYPLGCEETELCIRASQHWTQHQFLFEPRARVDHYVPMVRTRWSYFIMRCYAEGLSKALVSRWVGSSVGLASERAYTMRTLPLGILRGLRDVLRGDWHGLARAGAIVAGLAVTAAGYVVGLLSQTSKGRSNVQRPGERLQHRSKMSRAANLDK